MEKGLRRQSNVLHQAEKQPVEMLEVIDSIVPFESIRDAANFLGVPSQTLTAYLRLKTRIIRSKTNGKTYLIKKGK